MPHRCRRWLAMSLGALLWLALVVPAGSTCSGGAPNGVHDPGEGCDDGNLVETDACCNDCTDISCAPVGGLCGDVLVQSRTPEPWEQCDDGNALAGDGCEALCETTVLLPFNSDNDPANVRFDGFINQPIGDATLSLEPGPGGRQQLRVSHLGSALTDGARQLVGSCEMQTTLATPNFSQAVAGSTLVVKQIGIVDDVPGQLFSTVTFRNNGTDLDVLNDISPVQPTSYRVILYRGRDIVANIGGLSNGDLRVPGGMDVNNPDCAVDPVSGNVTVTGEKPTTTTMTTSTTVTTTFGTSSTSSTMILGGNGITVVGNGLTVAADRWLVTAERPGRHVKLQETIEMLGANVGDVVITHERTNPPPAPFDCNGNGVSDTDDIDSGTSMDVNANDLPDECEALIDPQTFSKGKAKCADTLASTVSSVFQKRTGCARKCEKRALGGRELATDCIPPYGGKTAACVNGVQAKALAALLGRCAPDLCVNPRGNGCEGYLASMVTLAEREADGVVGKLLCPQSTPSPAEAKCRQAVVREAASFTTKRTSCLRKCRKLEIDGRIPSGRCRPPAVVDEATMQCIADVETRAIERLGKRCVAFPGCLPFDAAGVLSLGAAFGDDFSPRIWGR
jgi:cysteine-rich repeat protein